MTFRYNTRSDSPDIDLVNGQVHFASLEEKKRIWWRNAIVNGLFISAWYDLVASQMHLTVPHF